MRFEFGININGEMIICHKDKETKLKETQIITNKIFPLIASYLTKNNKDVINVTLGRGYKDYELTISIKEK